MRTLKRVKDIVKALSGTRLYCIAAGIKTNQNAYNQMTANQIPWKYRPRIQLALAEVDARADEKLFSDHRSNVDALARFKQARKEMRNGRARA